MRIEVTQEDIELGDVTSTTCPVARAMRREWPEALVGAVRFITKPTAAGVEHDLPDDAVDWITDYDRGLPVKPFAFEVAV